MERQTEILRKEPSWRGELNSLKFFFFNYESIIYFELPQWLSIKESTCNVEDAGDVGLIPGGGQGNPLQYSYLENPMDKGAWRATVHRITESDKTEATGRTQHMITHLQET